MMKNKWLTITALTLFSLYAAAIGGCLLGDDIEALRAKAGIFPEVELPEGAGLTVTFNSGGGSSVPAQTVNSGSTAARPADPSRSGYTFDNWYSNSGLTTVYNFSTPVTAHITLYAKWNEVAPGSYTVIFNSGGGSGIATQLVNSGGTATRPADPSRSGYIFDNWYSDSGLTTVYNFSTPVTGNITLYTKWNPVPSGSYTVTFESDGGSSVATQIVSSGGTASRPADPTRSGYTFVDWYGDSGLTAAYDFSAPVTGNITLYAKWDASALSSYTVTFNSNGGSNVPAQTVNSGGTVVRPANPTRSGYTFVDWYGDSGLNVVYNFATPVTANITLYAKWNTGGTSGVLVEMVWVPGGSFQLGKDLGTAATGDETPISDVTVSGFYMGKYEVTGAQYQAVMGSNPGVGDNYPVYYVSWYDALVFCNKLSMAEGLTPAYRISNSTNPDDWGSVPTSSNSTWNAVEVVSGSTGYRLPTEAQWEYAAKGGDSTAAGWVGYTYSGSDNPDDVAWYSSNSRFSTYAVGTKAANRLGLYDMSGNVYEWCWDWYGSYTSAGKSDPTGASSGSKRVIRGGYWFYTALLVRSAARLNSDPDNRNNAIGFRLARPDSTAPLPNTVTFNINGGTGTTPSAQTANSGTAITLPSGNSFSRTGYTFGGWNANADGTGTNYSAGSLYTVTGNVTLYAKWNAGASDLTTVTSGADSGPGTLRYAIENALDGSTITIDSNVGTIRLESRLHISRNLTINGNGVTITRDASWTTIDNSSSLMHVYSGGTITVHISRIHFKDGRTTNDGGAIHSYENMSLESCIFSGNQGPIGAICNWDNNGTLSVKGCTFYGNHGPNSVGAIYSSRGTLILEGNLFYGNTNFSVYGPDVVKNDSGTITSRGYNVVDVPFGTGDNQSGWAAVIGDKRITDLPFSTTTFRLLSGSGAANVITTRPANYPTVDFYGNPIPASGAAAGAVQATVSGSGYNLELSVNDASRGTVNTSPVPNQDGLFSGTVTLTANAHTGYEFSYWLVDGEQTGSANPLTLTMSKHTKVQAAFGRVVLVNNFNDDMYSETTVGTLRNALVNAQDWDIIRFSGVTPGTSTVALYEALPEIDKSIIIEGNGVTLARSTSWTTVDSNSLLSFSSSGMFVNVSRIHFKNGRSNNRDGAAAVSNAGIMSMESCIFSGNQGDYYYGGNVNNSGTLTMKGCTFYGNTTDYGGGGAIYSSGSLILIGNLFYENTSEYHPILYYWRGTAVSNGYNVADVGLGEEYYKTGWEPAPTDTTFSDLAITGTPINTTTFAPVSGLGSVIPNPPPQGFPTTDFYGNTRTFPGAPGAVK